jgi:hypothetical protein
MGGLHLGYHELREIKSKLTKEMQLTEKELNKIVIKLSSLHA